MAEHEGFEPSSGRAARIVDAAVHAQDAQRRRTARGREAVEDAFGEADREASALIEVLDDAVIDTVVVTLERLAAVLERPGAPDGMRRRAV